MSRREARIAWAVVAATVAMLLGAGTLMTLRGLVGGDVAGAVLMAAFASYAVVGAFVLSRRPGHRIGRWFLVLGAGGALTLFTSAWAERAPALPERMFAAWIASWAWVWFVGPIAFVFLTFPDGTYLSRRWRWVAGLAWLMIAIFMAGIAISPVLHVTETLDLPNPIGIEALRGTPLDQGGIGWLLALVALPAAAVSLIVRFRRSPVEERQRIKWLAFAAAILAVGFLAVSLISGDEEPSDLALLPMFLGMLLFPFATGVAILRHRLFDIDVVISKAVAYATLAVFITGVYVGIVVGLGWLVGAGEEPNVALQVLATALIAVAFQPVRQRVQRVANRIVFGRRATPYEVMSEFSHRIARTMDVREALPDMARAAAEGVGARRVRVRLLLPRGSREEHWPPQDAEASDGEAFDLTIAIRHAGAPVGELAVRKEPGDPITPGERSLLEDLASQAGLAMHNVRLAEELAARARELAEQAEQLRRSRERLVTARDVQRRRLERDIREGPQRQLLAIGARLREASDVAETVPEAAGAILEELGERANATLEGLRDLARGIFPPLLADEGIVPALKAHVRKAGANATFDVRPGVADLRFDADTEAAVYFCCLQALQNVMRHAGNAPAVVSIDAKGSELRFSVIDRGPGFDPDAAPAGMGLQIMRDRVDALGGELAIASSAGGGTTVSGRLPVGEAAVVPA